MDFIAGTAPLSPPRLALHPPKHREKATQPNPHNPFHIPEKPGARNPSFYNPNPQTEAIFPSGLLTVPSTRPPSALPLSGRACSAHAGAMRRPGTAPPPVPPCRRPRRSLCHVRRRRGPGRALAASGGSCGGVRERGAAEGTGRRLGEPCERWGAGVRAGSCGSRGGQGGGCWGERVS